MTRPDAAADGSDDPRPDPGPDTLTDVLVLAAGAASAIADRARGDARRLAEAGSAGPEGPGALRAEADAASDTRSRLATELAGRGVDLDGAGAGLAPALRTWAAARPARDAAEALVGARLARGLVGDLAQGLGGETAAAHLGGVDDPLDEAAAGLLAEVLADRRAHDRLALLARRMLGDALVLVEALPGALPAVRTVLAAGGEGHDGRRALVKRVKSAHGRRVGALGL